MKYDPWEDKQIQCNFCWENNTDFDQWIADNHPSDYRTSREKYELSYCEANKKEFLKFVEKYNDEEEIDPQDKADDDNETLKEKDWK